MYCSNCGVQATGNFCHACGAKLASTTAIAAPVVPPAVPQVAPAVRWEDEYRYDVLIKVPHVRDSLARLALDASTGVSATDFMNLCDAAFKPFGPVAMTKVAPVLQGFYSQMGVKTGKQRVEIAPLPAGVALFRTLCSLARNGQKVKEVRQAEDGCLIHAVIPSSLWTMEARLLISVTKTPQGTRVEAATKVPGQIYDWGKSNRVLDRLFADLRTG